MIWYILAGIVALILLLLTVPLSLTVSADESGEVRLCGRVCGIAVYRSPKPERPVKLSDYTPRAIRKRERALERRRQRQERRALRKAKKHGQGQASTLKPPKADVPLTEKLAFIKDLAEVVLRRSLKHARVYVERLTITVATPDAATTAIFYGSVCAALAALTEALDHFSHLRIRDAQAFGVTADFLGDRTRASILLHFRLRVHHVLDIGLRALARMVARMLKR